MDQGQAWYTREKCLVMKTQIEKIKKLKHILLVYEDGATIRVPENKTLKIGTAFMKAIKDEHIEWEVGKLIDFSWIEKVKKFFMI